MEKQMGFKYFSCSPLLRQLIQFDLRIFFQMGWFNHQLENTTGGNETSWGQSIVYLHVVAEGRGCWSFVYFLGGSRWWFQTCFFFTLSWGDDPIWRTYFSNALKPPTRDDFGWSILTKPEIEWLVHLKITKKLIFEKDTHLNQASMTFGSMFIFQVVLKICTNEHILAVFKLWFSVKHYK